MSMSLTPDSPELLQPTPTNALVPRRKMFFFVLGLLLIIGLNLVIKVKLDRWSHTSYDILPDDVLTKPWKVLLPMCLDQGKIRMQGETIHWFTTGLVLVNTVERFLGPNLTFYFLNVLLILVTSLTSWLALRCTVFTLTSCICVAFGTQLHHGYSCSSVVAFYLFVCYAEVNLLAAYRLLSKTEYSPRWALAYGISLVLLALCHEQWLDYLAFAVLAGLFLTAYFLYRWETTRASRTALLMLGTLVLGFTYLAIRLSFGRQQSTPGHESEMIFAYKYRTLALEDFVSNVFSYTYISFTNYLPPFLVSSISDYKLDRQVILAEQHGYHENMQHLVIMHHQFYWYLYAGCVFTLFVLALLRYSRKSFRHGSPRHVALTVFLLMVLAGSAIHTLVKFRPYLSSPLLTYRCTTGVLAVTILISMTMTHWRQSWMSRRRSTLAIGLVWLVIFYSGLVRPHYLGHLSRQVGCGPYPDPSSCFKRTPK